ncbi:MAG: hypothetical protein OXI69_16040 [Acidobacteriota bacterium]|nr:hypothetical protein [Acidobacteriota bacterium]
MKNSRSSGNRRMLLGLAAAVWILQAQSLTAVTLESRTLQAWSAYVEATERRIAQEIESGRRFLALDFQPFSLADRELRTIASGGIPVARMATFDPRGREFTVDGGAIHHWRGCVLVPGADLEEVLSRIANPGPPDELQEDVLDSAVLGRGPDWLKIYLKLQRSKIVTVVYNTEHLVSYRRHKKGRASSRSEALKIAELEFPNSAREKEKPQGSDHGFLWRLNSYWRYQQVDGGVLVECESLSLSRSVPVLLEFLIRPIINRTARQSMQRTLAELRDRLIRSRRQKIAAIALGVAPR